MSQTFEPPPTAEIDEITEKIAAYTEGKMPVEELHKWRAWRDGQLAALAKLKEEFKQ